MELALDSVSGVICPVCISSPRGKYFIGIADATEFEIKAAKPCLHLARHLNIFPLILAVFATGGQT